MEQVQANKVEVEKGKSNKPYIYGSIFLGVIILFFLFFSFSNLESKEPKVEPIKEIKRSPQPVVQDATNISSPEFAANQLTSQVISYMPWVIAPIVLAILFQAFFGMRGGLS